MALNIENRIVSMIFDNAQFEKNVSTSKKTLKELDDQLKFKDADKNFKSLSDSANQVSFSSIVNSAEDMGIKIKASTIAGAEVIKRLTNSALDLAKTITSKVISPISGALNQIQTGGWNRATNIDQAKFQLEGLGVAWEDISEDIEYGVNETAYGLDSAARVASQLVASNVELGDDMKAALRGISGVAAMTNSTYDDIGSIFTRVAGQGRVMANDLNSLASRGLNAAAELGNAMGKTEAEIREMVSKGKIDFNTFSYYMNKAFGDHAKKANETFEGAMSNMNSALSRIGAEFASSYRMNMIPVYNALRTTFNAVKGSMGEVFLVADAIMTDLSERFTKYVDVFNRYVIESGALKSIFNGIANFAEGAYNIVTAIIDAIINAYRIVVPDLHAMGVEMSQWGTFADEFKKDVFRKPAESFHKISQSFLELTSSEDFINKLLSTIKTIVRITSTLVSIIKTVYGYAKDIFLQFKSVLNIQTKSLPETLETILGIITSIERFLKSSQVVAIIEQIKNTISFVVRFLRNALQTISRIAITIYDAWKSVFPASVINVFSTLFTKILSTVNYYLTTVGIVLRNVSSDTSVLSKIFTGLFRVIRAGSKIFSVIWEAVHVVFDNIIALFSRAHKAFQEVFSNDNDKTDTLVGNLWYVIDAIKRFVENLRFSEKTMDNFQRIFRGIFTVVALVKDIFVGAFSIITTVFGRAIGSMSKGTGGFIETITGIVAKIADWIVAIKDWLDEHDAINKAVLLIVKIFGSIITFVEKAIAWIRQASEEFRNFVFVVTGSTISEHFEHLKDAVGRAWARIKEFFSGLSASKDVEDAEKKLSPFAGAVNVLKSAFSGFSGFLQRTWPSMQKIFGFLGGALEKIIELAGNFLSKLNVPSVMSAGMGVAAIMSAWNNSFASLDWLIGKANTFLTKINTTLTTFQKQVNSENLLKIAKAVALLALSLVALSLVDPIRLGVAVGVFQSLLTELKATMEWFKALNETMKPKEVKRLRILAETAVMISASLLILSGALSVMGHMEWDEVARGLIATIVLLKVFSNTLTNLSKNVGKSKLGEVGGVMTSLSVAMVILSFALSKIGKMDNSAIIKSLIAMVVIFSLMKSVIHSFADSVNDKTNLNKLTSIGTTFILLAIAIKLLVKPIQTLGAMDFNSLVKGIGAIVVLMMTFSIALKLLAGESSKFSKTSEGTSKTSKNLKGVAIAMLAMAGSVLLLIPALQALENIKWETIGKAGAIIGGLMLLLTLFAVVAKDSLSAVSLAVSLLVIVYALKMLIEPLQALEKISWTSIGKAGAIIGGLLAAVLLASPAVIVLLAFAAALLLIGASTVLVGKGLIAIGTGLLLIAGAGSAAGLAVTAIMAALGKALPTLTTGLITAINAIFTGIIMLIPVLLSLIVKAITTIALAILEGVKTIIKGIIEAVTDILSPETLEALSKLIAGVLQLLIEAVPLVIELIAVLLEGIFDMIIKLAPKLGEVIITFIPVVLGAILVLLLALEAASATYTFILVNIVVNVIIGVLDGIAARAQDIVNSILNLVWQIVKAVFVGLYHYVAKFMEWFLPNVWPYIKDIAKKVWTAVSDWFVNLWNSIKEWFSTKWDQLKNWGKELIENLGEGIKETIDSVVDFFVGMWNKIVDFFGNIKSKIKGLGEKIVGWFKGGVDENGSDAAETMYAVAEDTVNAAAEAAKIHSPSAVTEEQGAYLDEGLALGIKKNLPKVSDAGRELGLTAVNSAGEGLDGLPDMMSDKMDFLNDEEYEIELTPVVNMDNLKVTGSNDDLVWYDSLGTNVNTGGNSLFSSYTNDNAEAVAAQESNNKLTEQTLSELQGMREDNITSSEATVESIESMAAKLEAIQSDLTTKFDNLSRAQNQNNQNTNTQISSVRNDLSVLATAINNIRVVLDTGAIAGDLTPKIDARLGKMAAYKGRGIS